MNMKRFGRIAVTLMLVIGIIGLVASPAQAADRYFCVTTGDWNVAANWDSDAPCEDGNPGVPGQDDRAIIQSGQTCSLDSSDLVDAITVESTGKLSVESGKVLTLKGENNNSTSTISGNVKLEGSGSEIAVTTTDHTFDGSGSITGHNSAAVISITFGETLTNEVTIHGKLLINGSGTFNNQGTVQADGGGVLHVNCDDVSDASGATWAVTPTLTTICGGCLPAASTLRFNVLLPDGFPPHALAGNFSVSTGVLDVDTSFKTTGRLMHSSGRINVANSASCTFDD